MSNQTSLKLQLLRLLLTLAPITRTIPINVNCLVHEQVVTMMHFFNYLILKDKCWCQTLKLFMFNVIQTVKLILILIYLYGACYNQDCLYRSFTETRNFPPNKQLGQEKLPLNRRNFVQDQAPKRGPSCLMASGLKLEKKVQGGRTKKRPNQSTAI